MDRLGFIHEKLDIKIFILFILRRLLHLQDEGFAVGGADHDVDAEGADLVRRGLRIAAADADGSVRIELLRAADGVAGFLVGDGGDGAGVDDIAVARLVEFTERMTMGQQHLLHCLRFVLVDLAPKGIKREFHR